MKTIRSTVLLVSLICGAAAHAQTQPTLSGATPLSLKEKTMTAAEKIKQLKPATNPVELMQLLNKVHEQGLLIDPSFMQDENILRLFGEGRIEETTTETTKTRLLYFRTFLPAKTNPLQFPIVVIGVKEAPGYGTIKIGAVIGDVKDALPFNYELIETHLIPGAQGEDPYGPLKPMNNEARNIAGGRPLATHPKGYWTYLESKKTASYSASVYVSLTRNAEVLSINMNQRENEQ